MYRYFAWTKGEYMGGQELLPIDKIVKLMRVMHNDCYISIQHFNQQAESLACPIYFDIDRVSLLDAYKDATEIKNEIEWELDVEPTVYFSGSKGFHVLIPYQIQHERCNEIARYIATNIYKDIDKSIYRSRGIIRVENTRNTKSGLYKVNVTDLMDTGLNQILERAKNRYVTDSIKPVQSDALDAFVARAVEQLPDLTQVDSYPQIYSDMFGDMTPCLAKMWNTEELIEGTRHTSVFILANFLYSRGASRKQLIDLFSQHPAYKEIPREYTKVIDSITRKVNVKEVGCVSGIHAEYLQSMCASPCWFKNGYKDFIRSEA